MRNTWPAGGGWLARIKFLTCHVWAEMPCTCAPTPLFCLFFVLFSRGLGIVLVSPQGLVVGSECTLQGELVWILPNVSIPHMCKCSEWLNHYSGYRLHAWFPTWSRICYEILNWDLASSLDHTCQTDHVHVDCCESIWYRPYTGFLYIKSCNVF